MHFNPNTPNYFSSRVALTKAFIGDLASFFHPHSGERRHEFVPSRETLLLFIPLLALFTVTKNAFVRRLSVYSGQRMLHDDFRGIFAPHGRVCMPESAWLCHVCIFCRG
jgi:hypothetical protein